MSITMCRKDIDLNKITRRIVTVFGGSDEGDPRTTGARVPEANFHKFVNEMAETVEKTLSK